MAVVVFCNLAPDGHGVGDSMFFSAALADQQLVVGVGINSKGNRQEAEFLEWCERLVFIHLVFLPGNAVVGAYHDLSVGSEGIGLEDAFADELGKAGILYSLFPID